VFAAVVSDTQENLAQLLQRFLSSVAALGEYDDADLAYIVSDTRHRLGVVLKIAQTLATPSTRTGRSAKPAMRRSRRASSEDNSVHLPVAPIDSDGIIDDDESDDDDDDDDDDDGEHDVTVGVESTRGSLDLNEELAVVGPVFQLACPWQRYCFQIIAVIRHRWMGQHAEHARIP
jgi:hypothetical protein